MVDCLDGLRHDTVVGSDDYDGDIRSLGAARTHCGKCCVTGGIKEGDVLAVNVYAVCTDVLSNTARLSCGYVCISYLIEQRGLTVVDVTHNDNDGCALDELVVAVLGIVKQTILDGDNDLLGRLCADILGYVQRGIKVDILGDVSHNARAHKSLDDLRCGDLESCRKVAYGDGFGDCYLERLLGHVILLLLAALIRAYSVLAAVCSVGVSAHRTACVLASVARAALLLCAAVLGYKAVELFIIAREIDGRCTCIDDARFLCGCGRLGEYLALFLVRCVALQHLILLCELLLALLILTHEILLHLRVCLCRYSVGAGSLAQLLHTLAPTVLNSLLGCLFGCGSCALFLLFALSVGILPLGLCLCIFFCPCGLCRLLDMTVTLCMLLGTLACGQTEIELSADVIVDADLMCRCGQGVDHIAELVGCELMCDACIASGQESRELLALESEVLCEAVDSVFLV